MSQAKARDGKETQESPQREGLRLLARLIARHILLGQTKQGMQFCDFKSYKIYLKNETADEEESDAKETRKDQRP